MRDAVVPGATPRASPGARVYACMRCSDGGSYHRVTGCIEVGEEMKKELGKKKDCPEYCPEHIHEQFQICLSANRVSHACISHIVAYEVQANVFTLNALNMSVLGTASITTKFRCSAIFVDYHAFISGYVRNVWKVCPMSIV